MQPAAHWLARRSLPRTTTYLRPAAIDRGEALEAALPGARLVFDRDDPAARVAQHEDDDGYEQTDDDAVQHLTERRRKDDGPRGEIVDGVHLRRPAEGIDEVLEKKGDGDEEN